MNSITLKNKDFIGKILDATDPENRGRYKVHIYRLSNLLNETDGLFCKNSVHAFRYTSVNDTSYGSYYPLLKDTFVIVRFSEDDINTGYIDRIVSDQEVDSLPYNMKDDRDTFYLLLKTPKFKNVLAFCEDTKEQPENSIHIYHNNMASYIIINKDGIFIKTDGDLNNDIKKSVNTKIGKDSNTQITGKQNTKVGGDSKNQITGGYDLKIGTNNNIEVNGIYNLKVSAACNITCGAMCSIKAGGMVAIDAPMVSINGGASGSAGGAGNASDVTIKEPKFLKQNEKQSLSTSSTDTTSSNGSSSTDSGDITNVGDDIVTDTSDNSATTTDSDDITVVDNNTTGSMGDDSQLIF